MGLSSLNVMPTLSIVSLDIIATSLFLGGAILLFVYALISYMGILPTRTRHREAFYAGKHVLITGGSSGIGKEIARLLVEVGASVTLVARNAEKLSAAALELAPLEESQAAVKRVNTAVADCSDVKRVEEMVDEVERMFGPIDILINSAGKAVGGYFETMDVELMKTQIDANYLTQLYPTHFIFKRMCARRSGHLVFISSMAGLTGVFGQAAYSASKYAVRGLAESLFYEARPFGVDVTVVFPPDTDTPGLAKERETMPNETVEISDTGGLFSPEKVAKMTIDGVMRKQYRVTFGLIGKMLGMLTAGYSPKVSFWEVLCMPLLRAITPLFLLDSYRAIRKGHLVRFPSVKNNRNVK